jgi:hypothetical protein
VFLNSSENTLAEESKNEKTITNIIKKKILPHLLANTLARACILNQTAWVFSSFCESRWAHGKRERERDG